MSALIKALVAARSPREIGFAVHAMTHEDFSRRNTFRPEVDRFRERIVFGPSDCWYWRGALNKDGYGSFTGFGEDHAHRASWVMHNGPIPQGMCVLHKCDAPNCVNPDHLFLGTHEDNMADMKAKGNRKRINIGARNGRAKLLPSDAKKIRELRAHGTSLLELSKMFAVAMSTISRVCRGESWNE